MLPLISAATVQTIVMFALLGFLFYFMLIRPGQKRMKAQQDMMNSITPGARVALLGGIFGTVSQMGEKQAVVEVAPGIEVTIAKQAIARVVPEGEDEFEYESADDVDGASIAGPSVTADDGSWQNPATAEETGAPVISEERVVAADEVSTTVPDDDGTSSSTQR